MRNQIAQLVLFALLAGCAGQSQPQIAGETTTTCKPATKDSESRSYDLADTNQVTFYGDLLPILSSNVDGKVYKCTTCHADMAKPDALNTVDKVNRAIESMENGRMPRPGNPVPKDKIELFRIWQLQGFQEGDPNAPKKATTTSTGSSTGTSSGTTCP